jgi:hypothetical protein
MEIGRFGDRFPIYFRGPNMIFLIKPLPNAAMDGITGTSPDRGKPSLAFVAAKTDKHVERYAEDIPTAETHRYTHCTRTLSPTEQYNP